MLVNTGPDTGWWVNYYSLSFYRYRVVANPWFIGPWLSAVFLVSHDGVRLRAYLNRVDIGCWIVFKSSSHKEVV